MDDPDWVKNGKGYDINPKYGFGVLNAGKMVAKSKTWKAVAKQGRCRKRPFNLKNK